MYTENGLLVDIGEIRNIVQNADVFAVGFRLFPERLIIDTRHDDKEIPMVAIADPVASLQERFFWLGQHRPSLGMPQAFMFFFWPHSVPYLKESGVWDMIRARVVASGFAGAGETVDAALEDLERRERAAHVDAITGARYQTIWSARAN
ncbi:MAG TPA: hypothetical protein VFC53_12325 [Dehalococcoidia bacterium]|nr:hypothetical protein [Dehalococcoidia bacterium]